MTFSQYFMFSLVAMFFDFFSFSDTAIVFFFETRSHVSSIIALANNDLELLIFLPLPSECMHSGIHYHA